MYIPTLYNTNANVINNYTDVKVVAFKIKFSISCPIKRIENSFDFVLQTIRLNLYFVIFKLYLNLPYNEKTC